MEEQDSSLQGASPEPDAALEQSRDRKGAGAEVAAEPSAEQPMGDAPQGDAALEQSRDREGAGAEVAAESSAEQPVGEAPQGDAAPEQSRDREGAGAEVAAEPSLSVEELMQSAEQPAMQAPQEDVQLKAVLEAIIYVAEEPLTVAQIAASLQEPAERVGELLAQLIEQFEQAGHGICIREIAGGYKMATKPEHHDAVRNFVKSLKPPLKLSLPALETLAVIAYKQPVTSPEVMEIRGVQGGGVIKTLLDRKLIAVAGRKNVIGKPILYKTTKEFLIQFGLKDLSELPTLKEFEELKRLAFDGDTVPAAQPIETAEVAEETPPADSETAPAEAGAEPKSEPGEEPEASQEA